jgi:hypothetical protein
MLTPLRDVPMSASIVLELRKEFSTSSSEELEVLINLYGAHWYLRANNFNAEAYQVATAIDGLQKAMERQKKGFRKT